MKPADFVQKYRPYAMQVETETGIPAIAILAQAALESGWGEKAIGNNFFGIKFNPRVNTNFREVLTTEYFEKRSDFENKGYSITNVEYHLGINKFKVVLKAKFADYETPEECFRQHAKLLLTKRYLPAFEFRNDPKQYLTQVWKCGYATDPDYPAKMSAMVDSIIKRL